MNTISDILTKYSSYTELKTPIPIPNLNIYDKEEIIAKYIRKRDDFNKVLAQYNTILKDLQLVHSHFKQEQEEVVLFFDTFTCTYDFETEELFLPLNVPTSLNLSIFYTKIKDFFYNTLFNFKVNYQAAHKTEIIEKIVIKEVEKIVYVRDERKWAEDESYKIEIEKKKKHIALLEQTSSIFKKSEEFSKKDTEIPDFFSKQINSVLRDVMDDKFSFNMSKTEKNSIKAKLNNLFYNKKKKVSMTMWMNLEKF